MNLLNKLTIKNLKLNKKRTIVTIIGIILSVALITAVASMYTSLIHSLINFEIAEKGNFHSAFYNIPVEDLANLGNNRAIENLYLTKSIGYAKINGQNEYKPYAFIKAFSNSALKNLAVTLVEGRLPENEQEIVIPTHLKTNGRLNLKVGDTITLDVGKRVTSDNYELDQSNPYNPYNDDGTPSNFEKLIETESKTYKIVGIIERPASSVEGYSAPGYTFITYLDDNNINGLVDVYVKLKSKDVKRAYEVTADILGINPQIFKKYYEGNFSIYDDIEEYTTELNKAKYQWDVNKYLIILETNPIGDSAIRGLGIVVVIVMVIIIFTSVFCIKNSFDISITEKTKQYGMLRSIGATKKQIKKNVFYEASILGIIGIPLGILSGLLASFILVIVSNYYLSSSLSLNIEFAFSIWAIVIACILGIVTIYLSALKSAKKASKVSLIDSIRNSANIKIKAKKIKSPKIIQKLFGIGGEISYKNIKRNKKKYRTTVISIIVSVFVFIALSSFMNMAFEAVDNQIKVTDYNLYVNASVENGDLDFKQKLRETTSLNNIEDCTMLREDYLLNKNVNYSKEYIDFFDYNEEEISDTYIGLYALGDYQYQKYVKSLGLNIDDVKDKGILINNITVAKYDNETGRSISKYLSVYDTKKSDKFVLVNDLEETNTIEIAYITDKVPFGLKNFSGAKFIISDALFDKIAINNHYDIFYKSSNASKLQDDIDKLLDGENYRISNTEEDVKMMQNLFTLIGIFLYGFIIVISLIGITNIFNTITTNMQLRKQELAMLKSIGMTSKEFKRMIRLESLFIGLKALIFGIPIGLALSFIIYYFLNYSEGLPYKLPIMASLLAVLAVFLLISLIMKYSLNKISKQNIIETIRNENI